LCWCPYGHVATHTTLALLSLFCDPHIKALDLLGRFVFDFESASARALQSFPLAVAPQARHSYDRVKFEVLSNWGDEVITCIYRLRIHGEPRTTPHGLSV